MQVSLDLIIFLLCAYVMGFIAAIPIGATQFEIARRSLNGFPTSALMIVAGSVISDTMYGIIAFFGIAPFLRDTTVIAVFWMVNAMILVVLGAWTIHESRNTKEDDDRTKKILKKHHVAFITGFSLAVTNPIMIMWWLIGAKIIDDTGLASLNGTHEIILFLMAGALGIGSYLSMLTFGIYKAKKFFTLRGIKRITFVFGTALLLLSVYFILESVSVLAKYKVPVRLFF